MATANPTLQPVPLSAPRRSLRDALISRIGIFSIFFLLLGLVILLRAPANYDSSVVTTFAFQAQTIENAAMLVVPTLPYLIVVGLLYLGGGLLGLAAQISGNEALARVANPLLVLDGVLLIPTSLVVVAAGQDVNITALLAISVRYSTPLVIGAMAGIWCERSGVTNIAIEGMMLTGACFGFITFTLLGTTLDTGTAQGLGVLAAVAAGGIMSLLHAWLSITFKTDQVVSGTVINILAIGVTSFLRREVLLSSEAGRATLQPINIPVLSDIPVLGPIFFQGRPIFYAMFVLLVVTHVVLYYTRWGLRTRAVGENPHAADTLGIKVERNRWTNVFIGGLIAGLAGAWFSLETSGTFDDGMTSGRGFIALAAMIFGKWTPFGAFLGGLLFGFFTNLDVTFQGLNVPVPAQFVQMMPYIVTIIVLAGLVGRAVAPKADGVPYYKEGK